ncbi:MAG: cation diffusion facilitator family transporter [Acidimicrobiales bacterium]|nr:cation diffusion facilitator family transporter [Acidimicrobiales bacterium]
MADDVEHSEPAPPVQDQSPNGAQDAALLSPAGHATEIVDGEAGHGHGTKAVVAALFANAAIAIAKFAGFLVTGSSSMLAESVHSVADSGNQGLLLLGGRRAKKAADEEHPFGYGRERYFWGFVVALVLFTLGSMFAIYEGLHKIDTADEHGLESPQWAIGILVFAIIAESFSFRTAIKEADKIRGDAGYWQFIRRSKTPELPVVLLEDLGALVGLVLALAGVGMAVVTDDPVWDGYGTLSIGILLGIIAIILVWEMKSLLIGESASRKDIEAMRAAIEAEPEVVRVIHLRAEHIGPDELLVGAKVEFLHELTVVEVAQAIDRVERNIRANVHAARIIYLEPDVHRDHRGAGVYVAEHQGHIDRSDPDYASITGQHRAIDTDEDIWSS